MVPVAVAVVRSRACSYSRRSFPPRGRPVYGTALRALAGYGAKNLHALERSVFWIQAAAEAGSFRLAPSGSAADYSIQHPGGIVQDLPAYELCIHQNTVSNDVETPLASPSYRCGAW